MLKALKEVKYTRENLLITSIVATELITRAK